MTDKRNTAPLMARGNCAANYDHISDKQKLEIWQQAKTKQGVIVQSVGSES